MAELDKEAQSAQNGKNISAFYTGITEKPVSFTNQEAGRATYKSGTPDKDKMKLILGKGQLAQKDKADFKEMEQE